MASFLPTADPGANVTVTKEEFNLFHNIDRQLFTRLVVGLGRDTSQSTHVMAFVLWLEKMSKDFRMVSNLLQWPDNLLSGLADEALLALNCIESAHFPFAVGIDKGLPLIQNLTRSNISLQYFHENRIGIITAVTKLHHDVCIRAFTDIVQQVQHQKAMKEQNFNFGSFYGPMPNPFMQQVMYYNPATGVGLVPQQIGVPQWNEGSSNAWVGGGFDSYDIASKKEFNQEFNEILARLDLSGGAGANTGAGAGAGAGASAGERKEVPADDRTIFMTFSKGYPISESEVRDFFSRRYGDIIEAVFMQDVLPLEQPLYARLVIHPAAINVIDVFLEGTNRVKFSINGKHVWARKYVRKGTKSPQTTSPVTSRPPSPSATGTSY